MSASSVVSYSTLLEDEPQRTNKNPKQTDTGANTVEWWRSHTVQCLMDQLLSLASAAATEAWKDGIIRCRWYILTGGPVTLFPGGLTEGRGPSLRVGDTFCRRPNRKRMSERGSAALRPTFAFCSRVHPTLLLLLLFIIRWISISLFDLPHERRPMAPRYSSRLSVGTPKASSGLVDCAPILGSQSFLWVDGKWHQADQSVPVVWVIL